MTDLPDDRRDEFQPPSADSPPPDGGTTGGEPPADRTPPQAGDPPSSPPASDPPPQSPAPAPQAQWPQQRTGMTVSEQRNWAVGAHIGALAAAVVAGLAILAPLVVYLVKKDEDAFVREHARESLNFQLTWLIGLIVAMILGFIVTLLTVGLALIVLVPAAIGFFVAWIVFMVMASMAASRGEYYRYPLTIRMVT